MVPQVIHDLFSLCSSFIASGEVAEPVAEKGVERGLSVASFFAGQLDDMLVGTEGDVFHHTKVVCTGFVVKDAN